MLAVAAPSLAHRAAAVLLGHPTLSREGALASSIAVVALFFPHVDALKRVRFLAQLIPDRTLADHTALCVDALTVFANVSGLQAFVYVCKGGGKKMIKQNIDCLNKTMYDMNMIL